MIDGVIKYHIEHQCNATPTFVGFEQLEALRTRLFALGLIGETDDGIGYGNLSLRVPNANQFFITATQTGKQANLKADEYTYIKSYDFSNFTVFSQGAFKPSSEALSHAMIYEVNNDINTVIHIHSHALWSLMKSNQNLNWLANP